MTLSATIEIVGSRKTSISVDAPTQELLFLASGSDDEPTIRAQIEALLSPTIAITSAFFGTLTLTIQNYEVTHKGNGVWDGIARYGRRIPRQTGDIVLTFDTTGGTQHISTSNFTTKFGLPGVSTFPQTKNAINIRNDNVEGVDIVVPIGKITFEYYPATALMTGDYINTLLSLAGSTNDDTWMDQDPNTWLFLGASGQPRGLDDWALLMHFIWAQNRDDIEIGDITGVQKDGHEYIWIKYKLGTSANSPVTTPEFAFVETVYPENDFTRLGIGSTLSGILAG